MDLMFSLDLFTVLWSLEQKLVIDCIHWIP